MSVTRPMGLPKAWVPTGKVPCRVNPAVWVTEDTVTAKILCEGCDVKARCLEAALSQGETYFVWGGTTQSERAEMLKRRKK